MTNIVNINRKYISNINLSVGLMFFYNYLSILSFSTLKEVIDLSQIVKIVILLLLISFLPDLIRDKYHWNLFFMVVAFLGVLISQFDGVTNYATITAVMIGTANKNIKPYIEALYYSLILGAVSVIFLRVVGFIPDRVVTSPRGINRYSFGFGSARGLSEMYLTYCQLYVYLNLDKIKNIGFVILFLPVIPINMLVDARATTILCTLFLLMAYFIQKRNSDKVLTNILYKLTTIGYFVSFISIYISSFFYTSSSSFWLKIDSILSSRLMLGHWYLEHFPLKILGQWIPINLDLETLLAKYNTDYLMLDSGYMTMLVEGGIIITVIITIVITIGLKKMERKNDNVGLLIWLIAILNLIQTRILKANSIEILLLSQAFELSDKDKGKYLSDFLK